MLIFDGVINIIECIFFSIFISEYFNFKNKKFYILMTTFIQMLIHGYSIYIDDYGIWLTVTIILFLISSICFQTKQLTFNTVYIVLVYNAFILMATFFALFTGKIFFSFLTIQNDDIMHIFACVFSKTIQIIITLFLLKRKDKIKMSFELKEWKNVLVIQFLLIIVISVLFYSLLTANYLFETSVLSFSVITIIAILFMNVLYQFDEMNKTLLNKMRQEQKNEFQIQKQNTFKQLKNELDRTEHRILYHLNLVESLIENKDYSDAKKIIQEYKEKIIKMKINLYTGNDVFDYILNNKIDDLQAKDVFVKSVVMIQKDNFYDDLEFLNYISDILDEFSSFSYLTLEIKQIDTYVKIKISDVNKDIETNKMNQNLLVKNYKNAKCKITKDYLTLLIERESLND